MSVRVPLVALCALCALCACPQAPPTRDVCFGDHVVPLVRTDCAPCHSNGEYSVRLRGESADASELQRFVRPGDPQASALLLWVTGFHDHPPIWVEGSRELAMLRAWIQEGARTECGAADADADADTDTDSDSDSDPDIETAQDADEDGDLDADPDSDPEYCGDGACTGEEDVEECPEDCPAVCGDDLCTHDETAESCEEDCAVSFKDDIVPNILWDCSICHAGGGYRVELNGDSGDYEEVMRYVDVKDPEANSGFLWWASGGGMHPVLWSRGGEEYELFLEWVLQGALDN